MTIELAAEVERGALVPAPPDRAERQDLLAHARERTRPDGAVALLDVGLHLGAEAEDEAPPRQHVQVVGGVRELHGAPRRRDRDRARNLEPGRVLGRERERQERIVRALEREGAVVAEGFDRSGLGGDGGEVGGEKRRVDQHMLSTARTGATCHVRPCASQAS